MFFIGMLSPSFDGKAPFTIFSTPPPPQGRLTPMNFFPIQFCAHGIPFLSPPNLPLSVSFHALIVPAKEYFAYNSRAPLTSLFPSICLRKVLALLERYFGHNVLQLPMLLPFLFRNVLPPAKTLGTSITGAFLDHGSFFHLSFAVFQWALRYLPNSFFPFECFTFWRKCPLAEVSP